MDETQPTPTQNTAQGFEAKARIALNLVLLFYSVDWTEEKKHKWAEGMNSLLGPCEKRPTKGYHYKHGPLSASNEATTKNLCNAVRAVLAHETPEAKRGGLQFMSDETLTAQSQATVQGQVAALTVEVTKAFRSFGGGQDSDFNPLTKMLKNKPPQFAAGVDIAKVVAFVLRRSADTDLVDWMEREKPNALCLCVFSGEKRNEKKIGHRWEINDAVTAPTLREVIREYRRKPKEGR